LSRTIKFLPLGQGVFESGELTKGAKIQGFLEGAGISKSIGWVKRQAIVRRLWDQPVNSFVDLQLARMIVEAIEHGQ
jgi:hypothetical protein